ncbi:MAG: hypothetical protein R2881_03125 [Eubacteriales bacterium]
MWIFTREMDVKIGVTIDIIRCLQYDADNHTKENTMPDENNRDQTPEILNEEEVQARFDGNKEKAKILERPRQDGSAFSNSWKKASKHIPVVGGRFSPEIPVLIALVKAFLEKALSGDSDRFRDRDRRRAALFPQSDRPDAGFSACHRGPL